MATRKKSAKPARDSTSARSSGADTGKLQAILEAFTASGLSELEYEDRDVIVKLSRHPRAAVSVAPTPVLTGIRAAEASVEVAAKAVTESESHFVKSPFVGTFYRSPSAEAPPFADVGQRVSKGQTLCIIEAMKLMNEIPSDVDGRVLEVLVDNGQPVQFGDALFKIAKT
ncbi:MAG: acetyl-CoA carboxylase biotin carboxyl carrier protein [Myxococcales bacterium]|nr:acetyl-CoA carboxylase biotin carboxyl carrier protein [Myxococcales bacterium]